MTARDGRDLGNRIEGAGGDVTRGGDHVRPPPEWSAVMTTAATTANFVGSTRAARGELTQL
jgi:hypothetical protein